MIIHCLILTLSNQYFHPNMVGKRVEWQLRHLYSEVEMTLHEMKKIAQYALNHELTAIEIDQLNGQLNELKREVHCLEKQLHSFGH
ncbi:hypothetical protein [Neobacillus thermocopriae]|uniref:hypothetical protein n=1 Tax=Neobacillus thermocopriae TaxID=1215031 RepID=UPI002E1D4E97|nr:hypothetical protein [Neobacillus thermocopriae]MED3713792.1 hypothetical protein [Neobacillus thermocopriae]